MRCDTLDEQRLLPVAYTLESRRDSSTIEWMEAHYRSKCTYITCCFGIFVTAIANRTNGLSEDSPLSKVLGLFLSRTNPYTKSKQARLKLCRDELSFV